VVYIQWNMNRHKKEWNLTIFNNTDISRGHHAKWNKSNRDYKHYMISYVKSKITKTNKIKWKQNQQTQRTNGQLTQVSTVERGRIRWIVKWYKPIIMKRIKSWGCNTQHKDSDTIVILCGDTWLKDSYSDHLTISYSMQMPNH